MKKVFLLTALACALLACANQSEARLFHGSGTGATPAACPQAIDNGCAAANQNGSFQNTSLLTSAQQSGQNSLLPTRAGGLLTFNIPAVDYPVGPDKTLTPKDPRTIVVTATTPCAYIGTGGNAPPNDYVGCFGGGAFPNALLDNYDFSGTKIGKSSIGLYMNTDAGAGSVMTVTNSYFGINTSGGAMLSWNGNWSLVYKNNQCDGASANSSSGSCINDNADAPGTSIDIEYNAFTNQGVPRVANGMTLATFTFKYNFVQGLNDLATPIHGEIALRNCSGARRNCTSTEDDTGNFIIWNRIAVHPQNNATFFPSDGASDGLALSFIKFVNNVVVNNLAGDGIATVGNGLFGQRASTLGNVTITGNWMDASGAGGCGISGATGGGNTVTASQSGNTLTITGLSGNFGNNPIEPGWMIFHAGYSTTSITAYGTGNGNTGTYTVNGSPQTVGSDSAWTVVPGFTSQTLSNNWLLNDPGHTGTPTAIGYSGPQFTAANCF